MVSTIERFPCTVYVGLTEHIHHPMGTHRSHTSHISTFSVQFVNIVMLAHPCRLQPTSWSVDTEWRVCCWGGMMSSSSSNCHSTRPCQVLRCPPPLHIDWCKVAEISFPSSIEGGHFARRTYSHSTYFWVITDTFLTDFTPALTCAPTYSTCTD